MVVVSPDEPIDLDNLPLQFAGIFETFPSEANGLSITREELAHSLQDDKRKMYLGGRRDGYRFDAVPGDPLRFVARSTKVDPTTGITMLQKVEKYRLDTPG